MPISNLTPAELCLAIAPESLGFSDTSELVDLPLPWIGQERAEAATRFGLGMCQPDYNLFVLGEVGSGRSSLLLQAIQVAAAERMIPLDLCYLHNFDAPERPLALRLPAGQGRLLRQQLLQTMKSLVMEIPQQLAGEACRAESSRIEKIYRQEEAKAYADLSTFAEERHFDIRREDGRMVFTLIGGSGQPLAEDVVMPLARADRVAVEQAEQELRTEIADYFEITRPLERVMNEALTMLRRQVVKPLLEQGLQEIRIGLTRQIKDAAKLNAWLENMEQDILENLASFQISDNDEASRQDGLEALLSRCRVNLVVDNADATGAPVVVEDNPLFRSLFGSIEYQMVNDVLVTDFSRIRAGSLMRAHGGFLLLHLRDLLADPVAWEKLRRFLRNGKLQIEEPGMAFTPMAAVSLEPEVVDVEVKIILIGSREQYYELQEEDPEFMRHFRIKVDFAESFVSSDVSRRASSIFVAHACRQLELPHFSASAVARLLEEGHREVDDQVRQSAIFSRTEALIMESADFCCARKNRLVEAIDVEAALKARAWRHDYPDQRLRESIADGDLLIALDGDKVGQINGLTQVDQGDYRFGFPLRITAHTYAGSDGLMNIGREVEMSGPIHDKGVFILQNYLAALFSHIAPLSLSASIVFEQEYHGVEGDSASCAELFVLLSSLSGLPLRQGIAVTGAVNQYGEVLPVGGINEKIEGYFSICAAAGFDGRQGVLIPHRNRRHLMLKGPVVDAVANGLFHIYTAEHVTEGIELLTGFPAGVLNEAGNYPQGSVLHHAQKNLQAYRRACHAPEPSKPVRKLLR